MAVSAGRMHYYPAALIGEFGLASGRSQRARDRVVWVASRRAPRPFLARASERGWDPGNPQIYRRSDERDSEAWLDELWKAPESAFGNFKAGLNEVAETGRAPAEGFVTVLAPFVAHLLSRPPLLYLPEPSDLSTESSTRDVALSERAGVFARFVDVLIYQRHWQLIDMPSDSFVSNDIGWQWLPGLDPGSLFVPVSPRRAILISGGEPSYGPRSTTVPIDVIEWPPEQVRLLRYCMTYSSPGDVYSPSRQWAETAIAAWAGNDAGFAEDSLIDAARIMATHPTPLFAGFLLSGSPLDPTAAWARFLAACHRFGCPLPGQLKAQGLGRRQRRRLLRAHDQQLRIAERSLRDGPRHDWRTAISDEGWPDR